MHAYFIFLSFNECKYNKKIYKGLIGIVLGLTCLRTTNMYIYLTLYLRVYVLCEVERLNNFKYYYLKKQEHKTCVKELQTSQIGILL